MKKKTNMSYKSKIKEIKSNREKYFPLIEMLLYVEKKTDKSELPIEMTDISQIALVMELIDIGYIDKESFIIKRNRRDITGLFYKGGYPLTAEGVKVYRQYLDERKKKYIRGVILIFLMLMAMFIFYMTARR